MTQLRLQDRVAIVTGSGQGIGLGIAARLSREGARVVVAELDQQTGQQAVAQIQAGGGRALLVQTDVTLAASVAHLVEATVETFGRLDILVNNAGGGHLKAFAELPAEAWQATLDLNLTSIFRCTQQALPYLSQSPHAAVINLASVHAYRTISGFNAYAAAKGGVVNLTRSLALELAPTIRVNAIAPGLIATEGWQKSVPDLAEARRHRLRYIPLGRLGAAEDIAALAAFLASDEAAFITGVTVPVDGGMTLNLYP